MGKAKVVFAVIGPKNHCRGAKILGDLFDILCVKLGHHCMCTNIQLQPLIDLFPTPFLIPTAPHISGDRFHELLFVLLPDLVLSNIPRQTIIDHLLVKRDPSNLFPIGLAPLQCMDLFSNEFQKQRSFSKTTEVVNRGQQLQNVIDVLFTQVAREIVTDLCLLKGKND